MSSTANESTKDRVPFRIENEEPETFNEMAGVQYITSVELGKLASALFKAAFVDCEGVLFETVPGAGPSFSVLFNHREYAEDERRGCERPGIDNVKTNSVIERNRRRDRLNSEGDRYYLTDDGKDAFAELLIPQAFDSNGKVNWKRVVGEWVDRSVQNYYSMGQVPQLTKVSGISLNEICKKIYGRKMKVKNGEEYYNVEYSVSIAAPISAPAYQAMNSSAASNYMLAITAINADEVQKMYQSLGLGTNGGAQIIR